MALGDSLGLPREGLSARRAERLFGSQLRHSLIGRRGMISDDTEHACLTAQALIRSAGEVERFERQLARGLRWWFAALPPATGLATLRACIRLWMGVSPARAGVNSAGNGACMRAPVIGVFASNREELVELSRGSAKITHRDERAIDGAVVIAMAARMSAAGQVDGAEFLHAMGEVLPAHSELLPLIDRAAKEQARRVSTRQFAVEIGCPDSVSGYVLHTVPVVVHAWLNHPKDVVRAIGAVIECGGDVDTLGALVGGIVAASPGAVLDLQQFQSIVDWPRSVRWIESVGVGLDGAASTRKPGVAPSVWYLPCLLRNAAFTSVVLVHGFRRLLPPY